MIYRFETQSPIWFLTSVILIGFGMFAGAVLRECARAAQYERQKLRPCRPAKWPFKEAPKPATVYPAYFSRIDRLNVRETRGIQ